MGEVRKFAFFEHEEKAIRMRSAASKVFIRKMLLFIVFMMYWIKNAKNIVEQVLNDVCNQSNGLEFSNDRFQFFLGFTKFDLEFSEHFILFTFFVA